MNMAAYDGVNVGVCGALGVFGRHSKNVNEPLFAIVCCSRQNRAFAQQCARRTDGLSD